MVYIINMQYINFINKLAHDFYGYLTIFLLLGISNIIFDIVEPKFAKSLIDISLENTYNIEFFIIAFIWIAIFLTRALFSYVYKRLILKYKLNAFKNLRKTLFEKLLKYPLEYFHKNSNGYILSRQIDDIEATEGLLLYNIITFILSVLELIILLVFMFNISFILTIIGIYILIFNISINFIFPIKKRYKEHNHEKANVLEKIQDSISGIKVIKSMNAELYEGDRFNKILKNYYKARTTRDIMDINRRSLESFLKGISYPLIIIIGGILVYNKVITVGSILAFTIYFSKLDGLLSPLISFIPLFKIGEAAMDRIYENLRLEIERTNCHKELKIKSGKVEFKNVKLNYGSSIDALKGVNIRIESGSKVAIVGPSGSGKSSIANLLLKFYNTKSGEILLDGKNIDNYTIEEIRNTIGLIQQESFLFNRTLKENLIYNKKITIEELDETINTTYSRNIISNLQLGLSTTIKDRGNTLSGGEKQRLCITREILKKPKIFILDEATSALDTIAEEFIQKAIDNISKDKTLIIITHKLSTIKNVDHIIVMDKGLVVECGNHSELINKKGLYYSMLNNII